MDEWIKKSVVPNQQNKQMSKIEPQAWKQGTDWQVSEERREMDKGGNKGKGIVKEQV